MSLKPLLKRRDLLLLVLGLASKYSDVRVNDNPVVSSRLRVMKLMFLLQKELPDVVGKLLSEKPYEFKPYLHGPFSKEILDDLDRLAREGLIKQHYVDLDPYGISYQVNFEITKEGQKRVNELISKLPRELVDEIENKVIKKYMSWSLRRLLDYVYSRYPEESTPAFY